MAASLKLSGKRAGGDISATGNEKVQMKGMKKSARPVQRQSSSFPLAMTADPQLQYRILLPLLFLDVAVALPSLCAAGQSEQGSCEG